MKISEIEKQLAVLREEIGDVDLEVRNPAGEFDAARLVDLVNVSRVCGLTEWHVFVDT